jgi:hypothetical protein
VALKRAWKGQLSVGRNKSHVREARWWPICSILPTLHQASFFSYSVHSSVLKTEAVLPSEILVTVYQTTGRHIPGDSNLHSHQCENLNPKMFWIINIYFLTRNWYLLKHTANLPTVETRLELYLMVYLAWSRLLMSWPWGHMGKYLTLHAAVMASGRGSLAGITHYGLDNQEIRVRFLVGARDFFFL